MTLDELHIAGLVVHVAPRRLKAVAAAIAAQRGALVHGASPGGKLVVTLEAASPEAMTLEVSAIQHIDGVLSAVLVYQCVDSLAAMNEEMTDA